MSPLAHITAAVTEAQSVLELVAERLADREAEEDFTLHAAVRAAIGRLDSVHETLAIDGMDCRHGLSGGRDLGFGASPRLCGRTC